VLWLGLNDAPLNRSPPQSVADEAVHGSNLISCRAPLLLAALSLRQRAHDILLASPLAATFKFAVRIFAMLLKLDQTADAKQNFIHHAYL
jgi:hypothetical protein